MFQQDTQEQGDCMEEERQSERDTKGTSINLLLQTEFDQLHLPNLSCKTLNAHFIVTYKIKMSDYNYY